MQISGRCAIVSLALAVAQLGDGINGRPVHLYVCLEKRMGFQ